MLTSDGLLVAAAVEAFRGYLQPVMVRSVSKSLNSTVSLSQAAALSDL